MKVKIKSPFEIELTTKQQLELNIIEIFNGCLETGMHGYIEFDEDHYISIANDGDNNKKLHATISLDEYLSGYTTLDQLLRIVKLDNFILDNFE